MQELFLQSNLVWRTDSNAENWRYCVEIDKKNILKRNKIYQILTNKTLIENKH